MSDMVQRVATSLKRRNIDADDLFYSIDANGDQTISYSELSGVLLQFEPTLTEKECIDAFYSFDHDQNGYVSLNEFRQAIRNVSLQPDVVKGGPSFSGTTLAQQRLHDLTSGLFRKFDVDNNGFIDFQELTTMLHKLDPSRWTPERIVALLQEMDSDKDYRVRFEEFHRWASAGGEDSSALLERASADAGSGDSKQSIASAAMDYASQGKWPDALNLLSANQDVFVNDLTDGCDYALLHFACDQGRTDVAGALLDQHGADPRVLTASGKTASSLALAKGFKDTEERVNIGLAKMAISWAAEDDWTKVIDVLHMHPTIVNILPENYTHRLLHYAASQGRAEIVTVLINGFGADPSLKDNDGRPPVDLAMQMKHVHLVEHLRVTGNVHARGAVGKLTGETTPPLCGRLNSQASSEAAQGPPSITAGDGSWVLEPRFARLLGMHPSTRWGAGDTDGEVSDEEETNGARPRGKGVLNGLFGGAPKRPTRAQAELAQKALRQIGALGLKGSLHGIGMEAGPIGLIADINYGLRSNMVTKTPERKRYETTLETFATSMHCFNHQQCAALVLLGDQIDKRDAVGADVAACTVLEQAARFHRPDRVGWLLGHHDTPYSSFFQQHRRLGNHDALARSVAPDVASPVRGAFCYEFAKFGEDRSNWLFIALDAYAVTAKGSDDAALWARDGRTVDRRVRLHGAIGAAQLQWMESRLSAAQNEGHQVAILSSSPLHGKKFLNSPPDRSHLGVVSCVQNSREVLEVIRRYSCVKLVISGHDHRGAHYQDRTGVHHVSLPACLTTPRGSLSGALLWLNRSCAALDFLVEPGKSLLRIFLTF